MKTKQTNLEQIRHDDRMDGEDAKRNNTQHMHEKAINIVELQPKPTNLSATYHASHSLDRQCCATPASLAP